MGKTSSGSQHFSTSLIYVSSQNTVQFLKNYFTLLTTLQTSITHHPFSFAAVDLVSCFTEERKAGRKHLLHPFVAKSFPDSLKWSIKMDALSPWLPLRYSERIFIATLSKKLVNIYYLHLLTSHSLLKLCFYHYAEYTLIKVTKDFNSGKSNGEFVIFISLTSEPIFDSWSHSFFRQFLHSGSHIPHSFCVLPPQCCILWCSLISICSNFLGDVN